MSYIIVYIYIYIFCIQNLVFFSHEFFSLLFFLINIHKRKQIVDHHRLLFYENIDKGYDVFVHTEDDTLVRPTTVLAFMHEMEKVRLLVGDKVSDER